MYVLSALAVGYLVGRYQDQLVPYVVTFWAFLKKTFGKGTPPPQSPAA